MRETNFTKELELLYHCQDIFISIVLIFEAINCFYAGILPELPLRIVMFLLPTPKRLSFQLPLKIGSFFCPPPR